MDQGVAKLNIEHFRRLLRQAGLDPEKRRIIHQLLSQEEQKLERLRSRARRLGAEARGVDQIHDRGTAPISDTIH
jgi:hypothetical protein